MKKRSNSLPYLVNNDNMKANQSFYYSEHDNDCHVMTQLENELQQFVQTKNRNNHISERELLQALIEECREQRNRIKELEKKVNILSNVSPFKKVFESLPANYPVYEVMLNGCSVPTTRFLNTEGELVHFSDEDNINSLHVNKIDGVRWGNEDIE
ncbi:hypothetical protein [Halalkalibacter sp. APA_J-10(15)]|uniref:hypothetical protein n=1 Tax=unclassified Halalkalibacter TaxID=2893063 RepID=UPI001FF526D6|nr:hypothetical protein [Halalkalibacter sp. APA_J-10(15)]MCK0472469.1 hypothetical protein [Halalkalibacter sp. APA_J-10(15)]